MNAFNDGLMLGGMIDMKCLLLHRYAEKNMIPSWDSSQLDNKDYQTFLRKLISWVIDELAEVSKENKIALDLLLNHGVARAGNEITASTIRSLEELADVMHFMLELMIFSGQNEHDINSYYMELLKERNLELIYSSDALTTTINYGSHTNIWDDQVRVIANITHNVNIRSLVDVAPEHVKISSELHMLRELCMWDMTKALSDVARNLKNKEWTMTFRETNRNKYLMDLMIAWLHFGKLLDLHQVTPKVMYDFFEKATKKNNKRLDDGY